jgi:hypothetical protein
MVGSSEAGLMNTTRVLTPDQLAERRQRFLKRGAKRTSGVASMKKARTEAGDWITQRLIAIGVPIDRHADVKAMFGWPAELCCAAKKDWISSVRAWWTSF